MNSSSRGAVIATAILAGTLGLASFVVMSGPAVRHRSPAPARAARALGSYTRAVQVRPADDLRPATPTTPAPTPTAKPTARPSAAPTTQPVAAVTPRPTTAPAPRTTPRPAPASTPKPVIVVVTPSASAEPTQLYVQLTWAGMNAPESVTLSPSGPINATAKTTARWTGTFSEDIQAAGPPPGPASGLTVAIGGGFLYLQIEGAWPDGTWPGSPGPATMTLTGDITGSYGCPGSMKSMSVPIVSKSGSSGSLSTGTDTGAFAGSAACPDGSAPTAHFTATASLAPG